MVVKSIFFIIVLWFLSLNFFQKNPCDVVSQYPQWAAFFLRGAVVCVFFAVITALKKDFYKTVLYAVVIIGVAEAVLSLLQLYGFITPRHVIFSQTGTFYNPGPLGCYLAFALPLALKEFLSEKVKTRKYLFGAALFVILVALPSTMSRTAWIAAFAASGYVFWNMTTVSEKIKKHLTLTSVISAVLVCAVLFFGLWKIKSASADGRLFLWKISCLAIEDKPVTGHENFSGAFGKFQEEYFSQPGNLETDDVFNAATPDYAFNEVLDFAVRNGIVKTAVLVFVFVYLSVMAHKRKLYGECAAMLAFGICAMTSYPLHIPAITAALLTVSAAVFSHIYNAEKRYFLPLFFAFLSVACFINYPIKNDLKKIEKLWLTAKVSGDLSKYQEIYLGGFENARFLFEYGQLLDKHDINPTFVLEKCLLLTADPMPLNIIGRWYQKEKNFQKAEECFLRAKHRNPSRLYPEYLLYFLYDEPEFLNAEKRKQQYEIIINKKIKIDSPAVREMITKVKNKENLVK